MTATPFHAYYTARILDSLQDDDKFIPTFASSDIKVYPYQVGAALFATRSPYTKGVVLMDESGLGKSTEAMLVVTQKWYEGNFEGHIHWRRRHNQPNDKTKMIGLVAEHIIVYAKNSDILRKNGVGKIDLTGDFSNPDNDPRGDWASKPWKVGSDQSGSRYEITSPTGKVYDEEWMGEKATFEALLADGRIIFPKGGDGMPRKKYFKFEREEEGQCATNWWEHAQFGHNQGANDCMTDLFGVKNVFSNPKPVELIRGLIQICNVKDDDIVLDFFSGSATTAHSLMLLNSEDGKSRKFILVQLPENLEKNYEAATGKTKAQIKVAIDYLLSANKPLLLSEVGKERVRLAGQKILDEITKETVDAAQYGESFEVDEVVRKHKNLDVGFKVFKLDTSNLKTWDGTPIQDKQIDLFYERLNAMIDTVKDDRTDMDVVYEVMLKMGIPLDVEVQYMEINDKIAYIVGDFILMICLADKITAEDIENMAQYAPAKIICAEAGFADDSALSNAHYILKDRAIELKLV